MSSMSVLFSIGDSTLNQLENSLVTCGTYDTISNFEFVFFKRAERGHCSFQRFKLLTTPAVYIKRASHKSFVFKWLKLFVLLLLRHLPNREQLESAMKIVPFFTRPCPPMNLGKLQ